MLNAQAASARRLVALCRLVFLEEGEGNEWFSSGSHGDTLRRAASDLSGLAGEALAVTAELGDAERRDADDRTASLARRSEPQQPGEAGSVQRAAAE